MIAYGRDWLSGVMKLFDRRNRFWRSLSKLLLFLIAASSGYFLFIEIRNLILYPVPADFSKIEIIFKICLTLTFATCSYVFFNTQRSQNWLILTLGLCSAIACYLISTYPQFRFFDLTQTIEYSSIEKAYHFLNFSKFYVSTLVILFGIIIWVSRADKATLTENEFT